MLNNIEKLIDLSPIPDADMKFDAKMVIEHTANNYKFFMGYECRKSCQNTYLATINK